MRSCQQWSGIMIGCWKNVCQIHIAIIALAVTTYPHNFKPQTSTLLSLLILLLDKVEQKAFTLEILPLNNIQERSRATIIPLLNSTIRSSNISNPTDGHLRVPNHILRLTTGPRHIHLKDRKGPQVGSSNQMQHLWLTANHQQARIHNLLRLNSRRLRQITLHKKQHLPLLIPMRHFTMGMPHKDQHQHQHQHRAMSRDNNRANRNTQQWYHL